MAFRIGAGIMPRFYIEPGIAFHKYYPNTPNSLSQNMYFSVEAATTMYGDRGFLLLGPKIGYQLQAGFWAAALETKYQSDGRNHDFVLTPKTGFSVLGLIDLMYGYQLSFNKRPFPHVGAHQLGLAFTLYRAAFTGPRAPVE